MKNPTMMIVVLVFSAIMGIALLARPNALTGGASGIPVTNSGTVLSVIAALLAIGVLIVAGIQQEKRKLKLGFLPLLSQTDQTMRSNRNQLFRGDEELYPSAIENDIENPFAKK